MGGGAVIRHRARTARTSRARPACAPQVTESLKLWSGTRLAYPDRMFGRSGPKKSAPRFGEMAIQLGFVRPAHVEKALGIQAHRERTGQPVPLLGEVLVSLGRLTAEQVEQVFSRLVQDAAPPERETRATGRSTAAPTSWWSRLRGRQGA